MAKCTGKVEVSVSKFTPNINLLQIEAKIPEKISIFPHASTAISDQNEYRRFELWDCKYRFSEILEFFPIPKQSEKFQLLGVLSWRGTKYEILPEFHQ